VRRLLALWVAGMLVATTAVATADSAEGCTPSISEIIPSRLFLGHEFEIRGTCLVSQTDTSIPILMIGDDNVRVSSATSSEIRATATLPTRENTLTLRSPSGEASFPVTVNNWSEPQPEEIRSGYIELKLTPGSSIDPIVGTFRVTDPYRPLERWLQEFPELDGWWAVRTNEDTMSKVRELAAHPSVQWVQPDMVGGQLLSNDTCFPNPTPAACDTSEPFIYNGIRYGDNGLWGFAQVSAESAWGQTNGVGARMAVLDSGVDDHPDMATAGGASRVIVKKDSTGEGLIPSEEHGTIVAGVAAASANNATGVAGVAPGVSILSYKVIKDDTTIVPVWEDALLEASVDDADVINMSFRSSFEFDLFTQTVITFVRGLGIVLVAAAGNSCREMSDYPAAYEGVISVAATNDGDSRAQWQYLPSGEPHFPCASGSNYGATIDISAPGTDILSTNWSLNGAFFSQCDSHLYCPDSGTSVASPMVAGAAALLAARGFYACEIEETLTGKDFNNNPVPADPADPVVADPWTDPEKMGIGRINVGKALGWHQGPVLTEESWPNGAIIHGRGGSQRYLLSGGAKYTTSSFNERSDQCVPNSLLNCIPTGPGLADDPDSDGLANPCDNCPNWANPQQNLPNWQLPPSDDPDCDGYPSSVPNGPGVVGARAGETIIGTFPTQHCPNTSNVNDEPTDAWPPDLNDSQLVNGADWLTFNNKMNSTAPGPPYNKRWDLNNNGIINGQDTLQLNDFMGKSCSP